MSLYGEWREGIVRQLVAEDAASVLALNQSDEAYFEHCPPAPNEASVQRDMRAHPEGLPPEHKHFLGWFVGDRLAAVMDILEGFPRPDTIWIGLLRVS